MRRSIYIAILFILIAFSAQFAIAETGLEAYKTRHETTRSAMDSDFTRATSRMSGYYGTSLDFSDALLNMDTSAERFLQQSADIVALPDGVYVVLWEDNRNGDFDIYAQMYDSDNTVIGAEIQLIYDEYGLDQRQPASASNSSGELVVSWIESDGNLYCRVFNSDLQEQTDRIQVNDNPGDNDCNLPDVSFLYGGSFGIVWEDVRSTQNIYCQLFTPLYESLGENFQINSSISGAQFWAPQITSGADSGFAVTWDEITGVGSNVSARTFTTGGVAKSSVLSLVDPVSASADQFQTTVSYLPETGYVASFIDTRESNQCVYTQIFDFSGSKNGANTQISDNSDYVSWDVSAAVSSTGETIITWASYGSRAEILGAFLDDNGDRDGSNFTISDDAVFYDRYDPHPIYKTNDSIIVAFTDMRSEEQDIYQQHLSETGNRIGSNELVSSNGTGAQQTGSEIAAYNSGQFVAVWKDERDDDGDIYLQAGQSNGTLFGSNEKVNTDLDPALQQMPDVDASDNGYITVVWQDFADLGNPGVAAIMARRYNSDGTPSADPVPLNDAGTTGERSEPSVSQASTGRATAVWVDRRDGADDIYGQGINATGNLDGDNFKINTDPSFSDNSIPKVGMNDANDLVAAWLSSVDDRDIIVFQLFDDRRDPIGSNTVIDSDSSENDCATFDLAVESESGAFVIVWLNEDSDGEWSILARRYAADGSENDDIITVSETVNAGYSDISVDIDGDGNFAVAWSEYNDGTKKAYYVITRSDNIADAVKPIPSEAGSASEPDCSIALSGNQAFTAWVSNSNSDAGYDIFTNSRTYTTTDADEITDDPIIPEDYILSQNYPNPFNPTTTIRFYLPRSSSAEVDILNVLGQTIETVNWDKLSAGWHEFSFDGDNLASGVYFYRLSTENYSAVRKMTLVK